MAELISNQHSIERRLTSDDTHQKNRIKDPRISSQPFLVKVAQCIKIANSIRDDYGIDILKTNGNFDITDEIIHRLDSLSSSYFQKNNNNNTFLNLSEEKNDNNCNSIISINNNNDEKIDEQCSIEIHYTPIQLPAKVEMQLRQHRLLRDAIRDYRRHERSVNSSITKKNNPIKPPAEEDIFLIDIAPLCSKQSNTTVSNSFSNIYPKSNENLLSVMKQINTQCKIKTNEKKKNKFAAEIESLLDDIMNEEIIFEISEKQIKQNQSKKLRKQNQFIQILPYENTYGQFYHPDQSSSIENTMIDKIINGVQAMSTALTTSKDFEDVFNGTILLSNQSSASTPPLFGEVDNKITNDLMNAVQKRFINQKDHSEQMHIRTALNLILADNRLNGRTILCRSDSLILSCMLRKIRMCIQMRTLCSYGDVLTTINEINSHEIHLKTYQRMSISFDEFIEILGEIYQTISSDTIETMKYYLEAKDIIDLDTSLVYSSISTIKQIDEMIKYILYEDAIRQLIKLIIERKRNRNLNNHFQLSLPTKLNDLYQPIKKLNAFMSPMQVMAAIRRPYIVQLTERSKLKAITASDLRSITSQIWLLPENFATLISENVISSEVLCQFYRDFHEKDDIDERLNKITKKLQEHLNSHSCITRVVFKMIAERSNGTNLTPFLEELNRNPRFLSITDIFDDIIQSGLISKTELIIYSKQDTIIKKSSLLKHFESISFIRKYDADLLAETTLVIREDGLIEHLTQRATFMKQSYIDCILNTDERKDFIEKNIIESTNRLSSVSIHQFIHQFNLDPICGKIFYWMGLTDENIVKTLIETKNFVNEYTLDGIYNNFLIRFHDTLESGIYYLSAENLTNNSINNEDLCKLGCYLTYEQASILVDFADPEYEHELLSLITIHDIISQQSYKKLIETNNLEELSSQILHKQQVIECKTLVDSFHERILFRQKRFERIEHLQRLLLSSPLFSHFMELIPDLGNEYFTHTELDYLEETKLIDIGVLALLLTLPSYDPLIHSHKYSWFQPTNSEQITSNYLHILDPIIEKYSIFLTTILLRIISYKERFSTVNEILLSHPNDYLSTEEVLKICSHEQILSYEDIIRICQESFPSLQTIDNNSNFVSTQQNSFDLNNNYENEDEQELDTPLPSMPDCYTKNMAMCANDSNQPQKSEQTVMISIFDHILHFNHQSVINEQLRKLFRVFKPLSIYTAQLLIEKEMTIIKLLLKTRQQQQQAKLTLDDLNRYLQSYPIPCRLDILNKLRRIKLISQSLTDEYTMNQCYELKSSTPENQTIFVYYMLIKLIREEGYLDEPSLKTFLEQSEDKSFLEKFDNIFKEILRQGFLTIEQILQSTKDFFLQDYFNENILQNQLSEYKIVIQKPIITNILEQKQITNTQLQSILNKNLRRRQVIPITILPNQLNSIRKAKEKVQRKVDNVLLKPDDTNPSKSFHKKSSNLPSETTQQPSLNLRTLRHHYIQSKIPKNQLHLLVEQGGWNDDIFQKFQHELNIIDSDNSLELIRYITENITILSKENGLVDEKTLMKHFQEHQILFQSDFDLLLNRYGMIDLDDLIDLLVVCKVAKAVEIKSYAKELYCLNVNKFNEISKLKEDTLVRKNDVLNNLEKKLCITPTDLSQLLNHVLKLDRLKRIIELMPTIQNYIRSHPINTFDAVKALKLECKYVLRKPKN